MSAESYATTLKALLTIADPPVPCLDRDEAQDLATAGKLPARYTVIDLQRRTVASQKRMDGSFTPIGWRLTTRPNAKKVTDAREIERRIEAMFNPPSLVTLDGSQIVVSHEQGGGDFGERDSGGYYSAGTDWTFVR